MEKMHSISIGIAVLLVAMTSCTNSQQQESKPELTLQWETEAVFNIPESVCYDQTGNVLYVSNVNGNPTDQDSNGYISKCAMNGEILDLEWATGLHAPKGMGIFEGKLYASDIDRVAEIDLSTGAVIKFYEVPEATFLNDIAVDEKGNVYISDMMDTKIYCISGGSIELWLDDPLLTGPNGLFVLDDKLMIGCKKIVSAGLEDKVLEEWLLETGGIDGLESTGDGQFLFSDWQGHVFLVDDEKEIHTLLDLTEEGKNAADIEYIISEKSLFVPTFSANTVIAYTLKY
jgi:hypothetical protein